MHSILILLEESAVLDSVLQCAFLVGRRFGGYLEGLRVQPTMSGIIAAGADGGLAAAPALEESFRKEQREATLRLHERFDRFMRERGVTQGERPVAGGPSARWHEVEASHGDVAGSRARLFDLTVVGRPLRGAAAPSATLLETILFEGGRPILIAPPAPPASLGDRVVVAWNGSTETARSVALGLPFLARAKSVVVLTILGAAVHGPSAAEAAEHLGRHGIAARPLEIEARGRATGEAILAEAAALDADLLIKGAYTHSRLRQMIFGGATSHILAAAELPVLMAH